MNPPSKTESDTQGTQRPGDARREVIDSLIARIDAILSEVEEAFLDLAKAV